MKNKKNTCYTYFKIVGNFDPAVMEQRLGFKPFNSWKIGDLRRDGKPFDFATYDILKVDEYSPYTYEMMEKTIEPLLDKIDILKQIKKEFDVEFYLVVVPEIYVDSISPAVAPSLKVMDFCSAIRCKLDIDMYIFK